MTYDSLNPESPRHPLWLEWLTAGLLIVITLVYLVDLHLRFLDVRAYGYGWRYGWLATGWVLAGYLIVVRHSRLGLMLAGGFALLALAGHVWLQQVGGPFIPGGRWSSPLGMAALAGEVLVVLASAGLLFRRRSY